MHSTRLLLLLAIAALLIPAAFAQEFDPVVDPASEFAPEEYGCSPGTLMQWSRGNSFEGGPDLDEPIVTDRPDFTEASVTVGRGVFQIESGYTYSFDNDGTQTIGHSYPETLFRLGMFAEWFEWRLAWNYAHEIVEGVERDGAEDLYLGFKLALTPQEGILPEMALVPQMTVPTGGRSFRADEAMPGVNWLYGWDINDWLGTGGSTQFNRTPDDATGEAYTQWAQSWTVNYGLTDRLGAYTEYFGFYPHSADTARVEHYIDGGFTYLFSDDIQWDIRGGVGLNASADDYFVGTGLSLRFK
jgi:outer membrane putative beta-barrel porin/alpha-amylase